MKADYKEILTFAVGNEIEAYEFYLGVSSKIKDANISAIFKELAEEEKKHRSFLEGLLSSGQPLQFEELSDYRVSETIDRPKLSLEMKPADAIALAIKNEEDAMKMYADLAKSANQSDQKKMFESLSKMEQGHKVKLEELYSSMAFPEVW
jgi:rubrerythrin